MRFLFCPLAKEGAQDRGRGILAIGESRLFQCSVARIS